MHWLSDQAVPYFLTVDEFGLADSPVQIITLDDTLYHHPNAAAMARRDQIWHHLGGNPIIDWADKVEESFCADSAIFGADGHPLTNYNLELRPDVVMGDWPRYQKFAK